MSKSINTIKAKIHLQSDLNSDRKEVNGDNRTNCDYLNLNNLDIFTNENYEKVEVSDTSN